MPGGSPGIFVFRKEVLHPHGDEQSKRERLKKGLNVPGVQAVSGSFDCGGKVRPPSLRMTTCGVSEEIGSLRDGPPVR
jgi:hypothetical protein